jgi:Leucyl/phenylalanyl-tRNA protein transferase
MAQTGPSTQYRNLGQRPVGRGPVRNKPGWHVFWRIDVRPCAADASKIALAYLLRFLLKHNVEWIDCQQQTRHFASLGATALPLHHFLEHVSQAILALSPPWTAGRLDHTGALHPLKEDTV